MNRTIAATLAVALALSAAAPALAKKKRPAVAATAQVVQKLDTNASRTIDTGEWAAAGGQDAGFALIDANANGELGFFEMLRAVVYRALKSRGS